VAELLKKGACVSCHGDNFAKPIDPTYPKIAGQHADYLFVALKSYKDRGQRHLGPQQRRDGRALPSSSRTRNSRPWPTTCLAADRPEDGAAVKFR
jgi:mono/diheme cytochrome c family protein